MMYHRDRASKSASASHFLLYCYCRGRGRAYFINDDATSSPESENANDVCLVSVRVVLAQVHVVPTYDCHYMLGASFVNCHSLSYC